jgi:structural maintenance of chromosome 4
MKKCEIMEHEANLEGEEKMLEGIQDSLKGGFMVSLHLSPFLIWILDKTQVFHEQIKTKQKELQPWTAKINIKQAAIDIVSSEQDVCTKKVTGLKDAVMQVEGQLTELQVEQEGKVLF